MQELLFSRGLLGGAKSFKALPTVHQGRIFEEWSMYVLQSCLSMSLARVGGKADGGIDLQGWWWLPTEEPAQESPPYRRRLRVLGQCKAEAKKIGPKYVREMEVPHSNIAPPSATVGLFISSSPFSKMTMLRAHSSPLPLALLHLPCPTLEQYESMAQNTPSEPANDSIGSIIFNTALGGSSGVLRGDFEPRWEYSTIGEHVGRPTLWWRGNKMSGFPHAEEEMSSAI